MTALVLKKLGLHFWSRILIFFSAVFLLHMVVKIFTIVLVSESAVFDAGRIFWMQLFSIQVIPTIIAYAFLIGIAYVQFVKAGRIMNMLHVKDIEAERSKTTVESMQKLTACLSEYIAQNNNMILAWIAHRKDKGESTPQIIEEASSKISGIIGTFSEISFTIPYNSTVQSPDRYCEILREKLEQLEVQGQKAV